MSEERTVEESISPFLLQQCCAMLLALTVKYPSRLLRVLGSEAKVDSIIRRPHLHHMTIT